MVKILFFGRLSDAAQPLDRPLPDGVRTVEALADWLAAEAPALGDLLGQPGVRIAVNQRFTTTGQAISDDDEIAFMSPLSGG